MKQVLLFAVAFFLCMANAVAQGPTLTSANTTPHIGEAFQNQIARATNVPVYTGGAAQTWDYSNLADSPVAARLLVVTPASTPYADSFPASNLVLKTVNDSNFVYFNSQTTQLTILGAATADTGSIKYTTPKIYLPYPFSYGSFFTSPVVEQSARYGLTLTGTDSLSGDGYGTLILPTKTYTNVLRVQYIENVSDTRDTTIDIDGFPVPATVTLNIRTTSYLYFTPDIHDPLLTVNITVSSASATVFGIPAPNFGYTTSSEDVSYFQSSSVLPLSFVSLNASLQNKEVLLQWKTAQEINTSHFSIQRSLTNSSDFSDIAEASATGSNAGALYHYSDQSFIKTSVPPTVYYRIRETDKDGKQFYSSIVVVHGNANVISFYPNPAKSFIHININEAAVADAITIFDAKGHLVKQWHNYGIAQPIDVSNLAKGAYFIQVKIKDKTTTTTLLKEE